MAGAFEITCGKAKATTTGVDGALDVPVTVVFGSLSMAGEVTLAKDYDGGWVLYGPSADHWVSGALLRDLSMLCDAVRLREVLSSLSADAHWACEEYEFDALHGAGSYAERASANARSASILSAGKVRGQTEECEYRACPSCGEMIECFERRGTSWTGREYIEHQQIEHGAVLPPRKLTPVELELDRDLQHAQAMDMRLELNKLRGDFEAYKARVNAIAREIARECVEGESESDVIQSVHTKADSLIALGKQVR